MMMVMPSTLVAQVLDDARVVTMTVNELSSPVKNAIGSVETSIRSVAEDIAAAHEQGATQRQIAKAAAWVKRLLNWRAAT